MNIHDLMTDDLGKVGEFAAACDELIDSRYILAEGKIIKILQTVAISNVLQRIICGALKGFDYGETARKWSDGSIAPPLPQKEHIALVFCVLADIDNRAIYLNDFLRKFFWDGDINSAYAAFCMKLVEPFKRYVCGALSQARSRDSEIRRDFSALQRKAMDLAEALEASSKLSRKEKDEYIFLCDALVDNARRDMAAARSTANSLGRKISDFPEFAPFLASVVRELG